MKKIRLDGVVGWDVTAERVASQLEGDVELIMNSPGGDMLEGFSIYNAIKEHDGQVTARVDFAASMMSVIAMAADTVIMPENSSLMMIHRPWSGQIGTSDDLRATADVLDKLQGMITPIYAERTGLDQGEISAMLDAETYMTGVEAVDLGFADKLQTDSSAKNMLPTMLAAAKSVDKTHIDLAKMAVAIEKLTNSAPSARVGLGNAGTLPEVEEILRGSFAASHKEAAAIVAAIKRVTGGPADASAIDAAFNSLLKK